MIPVNIAIDLETLALGPDALVLSVGLVAFTVHGGIVGTYYVEFNRDQQVEAGRMIDPDTVAWWEKQSPEARAMFSGPGTVMSEALSGVHSFFRQFENASYKVEGVWGYGSDFDNVILKSLFDTFDVQCPWGFRLNRCGRTLLSVFPPAKKAPKIGTHHHALDDARWLAESVRRALAPQLF